MIISLVNDAFVSKSSEFLSIIALRLDDLCQTLTSKTIIIIINESV